MSRWLRVIPITVGVIFILVAIMYVIKGHEIQRLMAVNELYNPARIAHNFSHSHELFFTRELPTQDDDHQPFAHRDTPLRSLDDFLVARSVTALVVLHHGEIVQERYLQGTQPDDLRNIWGLSIAALNLLTGVALEQHHIRSIDDPVTRYARHLIGTSYDGVTIRHLLQMTSGVSFNENRLNPRSDIHRMERSLAWGRSLEDFIEKRRPRTSVAGHHWHYSSLDAEVLGEVLSHAVSSPIETWMARALFDVTGVSHAPRYIRDKQGRLFYSGGLVMTARDVARLGQVMVESGSFRGKHIVPSSWIDASFQPSEATKGKDPRFGYLWWIPQDGDAHDALIQAGYGQFLYVHPSQEVVIVVLATDRRYDDPRAYRTSLALFRAITADLAAQDQANDPLHTDIPRSAAPHETDDLPDVPAPDPPSTPP